MNSMAGATTLGELASALAARADDASIVAELKAGSEEAYGWLIEHYHQQVYSLVYRIVNDSADAADTTQEVFLKVFRGIQRFNGDSSLKTWLYRIALHEAANQRRWWFRHKSHETTIEAPSANDTEDGAAFGLKDVLIDENSSPYQNRIQGELREHIEAELAEIPEPYRTTVILRDVEELSYEEIAEVMETNLGTVKSRLMRGRDALRKRLEPFIREMSASPRGRPAAAAGREVEVTS